MGKRNVSEIIKVSLKELSFIFFFISTSLFLVLYKNVKLSGTDSGAKNNCSVTCGSDHNTCD